jgi:hypothetical protein
MAKVIVAESRHETASNVQFGLALPTIISPINSALPFVLGNPVEIGEP